jgi:hypothetical protein
MPFCCRIIVVDKPKQVFHDWPLEKQTVFPEKIFFREGNIHEIDFPRNLFIVIEKRLNLVQIRVGRELFRQPDRINIV